MIRSWITLLEASDPTDNPAFRHWFRASKVVDADERPLTVYHGTDKEFEIFVPQTGERGDGLLFIDTVKSPFKFFSGDINYAYDVASAKADYRGVVLRCFLRIERPIDLATPAGRIAFNRIFGSFEKHDKVIAARKKIESLRDDLEMERRFKPSAATNYSVFDKDGKKIGMTTKARPETGNTYKPVVITLQQAMAYQASEIKRIEAKITKAEAMVDVAVGKIKQPNSVWDPLDELDAGERVKAAGFDGIIFRENSGEVTYAIIDSNQAKSIKNRGAFDPDSQNINEKHIGN